jgi:N-acetylneuraminic acid mutarotase
MKQRRPATSSTGRRRLAVAAAALSMMGTLFLPTGAALAHEGDAAALQVSSSAGRTPSASLSGATVKGSVYAFLPAEPDMVSVEFWLDNPAMTGAPRHTERAAPYDFVGGTATTATPLNTTSLTEGPHTISVRVTYADADVVTGSTTFAVDNVPDQPAPTGSVVRVNAGGPAVTASGKSFGADSGFTGGKTYRNTAVTAIAGTTDDALYLDERSATTARGSFGYALPAPVAGSYSVTLHFAELYHGAPGGGPGGAGRRVFSVNAEGGAPELANFDIFAAVGAATATTRTFTVPVTDGRLDLAFTATTDQPSVAAIEVTGPGGGGPAPGTGTGDPSLFGWDSKMPSPIGRSEGQGAAVGGKLYVFGGFYTGTTTTARSDVYDTAADSWTRLPDLPEKTTHSATVADGNTIWIVGGYVGDHPGPSTRRVWKFDTVSRTYTAGPQLPAPRGAGAAAIVGRQLHFYGGTSRVAGSTADPDQPDHWVLNLDGGTTWTARAPLPNPRNHLTGIALDGKVYAIGGQYNENENTGLQTDVHRYDPATNAWTKLAGLPKARSHVVAVVRDGQILVLGGTNAGNIASGDVTAYDPVRNVWAQLPSLPGGRKTPVAAVVGGTLYVTGGSHATATYAGRFTARWANGPAMPVALGEVAGGVIGGSLYLVGESNNATLALNLGTGTWRRDLPVRPFVGHHHTAEVLNGKLYLFGGLGAGAGKVQIFDPATNAWTVGPDMPFAAGSASSAVINGQVYVAGGIIGSTTTNRVARFNPGTGVWTAMAPMPQGRNHAAATTDGTLMYVAGGRGAGSGDGNVVANGFDTLQVYDPVANSWKSSADAASGLPPLPQARGGMGRAVFSGGEMYVIGGETESGAGATSRKVYQRVDVYNPQTRTWRLGTPMPTARHGIYPVLVGNRITVAGGGVQAAFSSSGVVETYTVR